MSANVSFVDTGVGFGTTLPTSTIPFTNFLLQLGFYQAHLEIPVANIMPVTGQFSFGSFPLTIWNANLGNVSGDRLFSVTTANTSAALLNSASSDLPLFTPCLLILTQLK
jgi:hypothetical protein